MVGYWSQKWSTKVKKQVFPEFVQKGLGTVTVALGILGTCFYNDVMFFEIKQNDLLSLLFINLPIFPVKFLILGLLNSLSWAC